MNEDLGKNILVKIIAEYDKYSDESKLPNQLDILIKLKISIK